MSPGPMRARRPVATTRSSGAACIEGVGGGCVVFGGVGVVCGESNSNAAMASMVPFPGRSGGGGPAQAAPSAHPVLKDDELLLALAHGEEVLVVSPRLAERAQPPPGRLVDR